MNIRKIPDYPSVNATEAGEIFGWSRDTFAKKFKQGLLGIIGSQRRSNITLYRLLDVVESAYPDASKHTRHMIAADVMYHKMERRINGGRKRKDETAQET